MAPANYYSKRELAKIGVEGFALIDEFYGDGGGKDTRKRRPNYAAAMGSVSFPAASSGGNSRKLQQNCSYSYFPTESLVCWTPVVAATTETTTVIGGYEAAGKLQGGGSVLMDNNYNQY